MVCKEKILKFEVLVLFSTGVAFPKGQRHELQPLVKRMNELTKFHFQANINSIGIVVQLVRAPPCHGGSCGFESRQSRFLGKVFYL